MAARLDRAAELIATTGRVVAFTGAGVSTESGIPDFRSPTGLWARYDPDDFSFPNFMRSEDARRRYWAVGRELYAAIRSAAAEPCSPGARRAGATGSPRLRHHAERGRPAPASGNGSGEGDRATRKCHAGPVPRLRSPVFPGRDPGPPPGRGVSAGVRGVRRDSQAADRPVRRADARRRRGAGRGAGPGGRLLPGGGLVARRLPGRVHAELRERGGRSPAWWSISHRPGWTTSPTWCWPGRRHAMLAGLVERVEARAIR